MSTLIRRTTDDDLTTVLAWLKESYDQDGVGFWNNRRLIADAHSAREMLVMAVDGELVAFKVGGDGAIDILEVIPWRRGEGHGRVLAEHCIEVARGADVAVLKIQCAPEESLSFWRKMGFLPLTPSSSGVYAYHILERTVALPPEATPVEIAVELYDSSVQWQPDEPAVLRFTPHAVKLTAREVLLAERIALFDGLGRVTRDPIVKIEVDRRQLYFDKAKYEGAAALGVRQAACSTFVVEELLLPEVY